MGLIVEESNRLRFERTFTRCYAKSERFRMISWHIMFAESSELCYIRFYQWVLPLRTRVYRRI
jgi:hypothetical protein